ncbi:RNA-guided endonuclease InsQ/TnpB family protein [Halosimplex halobium]|uniref:RNA-guided endonuclease InsQ/TnpB family protein n=1 Tax=Halosimplex halobium TaxID=3396618 RepID=UPI003F54DF64
MEIRRTVRVKLDVDSEAAALLEDTVDAFLWSAQYVVDHAFEGEHVTTSKTTLDDETYDDIREQTGGFNGGLVQAARNKAAEACRSVVARWKQGKAASKPEFTSPHVVYDHRTATFHDEYVTLATTEGRVRADYVLPNDACGTPHGKYLLADDYETTGAELHYRDGDWMLHIHCKREVESDTSDQAATENGTVLGVDLGVDNIAVTSTGRFWSGDEFNHWRREYEQHRSDLQQCGTRWAHEAIKAVSRTEAGRFKTLLHRIANELIAEARKTGCTVIAFEDLTGIRERTNASWGHKWAFDRLYEYAEYKAATHGIAVEQVNPADTSRRCSHCGFTDSNNRDGETFGCGECGYENHADYNAAKNIGLRYLRRTQTGGDGGAPLGVRLNSGMLTVNGGYSPGSPEAGTEVHAETRERGG